MFPKSCSEFGLKFFKVSLNCLTFYNLKFDLTFDDNQNTINSNINDASFFVVGHPLIRQIRLERGNEKLNQKKTFFNDIKNEV